MQDWSEGYVTEVGYTYGYYPELNPVHARFALLAAGVAPPAMRTACELGFGQGLAINLHAAAGPADWHGTDFNPAHAGFARELAGEGGFAQRLVDEAFDIFCRRTDLPDFDFIALHGIWSWVSDANRAVLADFIRRKLSVGGVLYISYNTQPGAALIAPLRDLLRGYADALLPAATSSAQRIDAALDFAERVLGAGAAFGRVNPIAAEQLKRLRGMDRRYLAHEYFNRDWKAMPFAEMAGVLHEAKLQFACSAHYLDHVPALHLTPAQQQLLAETPEGAFRETVRDFLMNQRFRRDYWVRGARPLGPTRQAELLRAQRIVLTDRPDTITFEVAGLLGKATLSEAVYRPILAQLADGQAHALGDIEHALARHGVTLGQIVQAAMVLSVKGVAQPAQESLEAERAAAGARRLNARLCRMARHAGEVEWLTSPVTGGGQAVSRVEQLFLLARSEGAALPEDWARYAAAVLNDGTGYSLPVLITQASEFQQQKLPLLEALLMTE